MLVRKRLRVSRRLNKKNVIYIGEAVLTSTHNLCFEQKYEKKISEFLVVKLSIYLNRRVFVMKTEKQWSLILKVTSMLS